MAWTSLSFAYGSLLTSAKMTNLSDNITALANGDSGAPSIQEAAMGAASVNQAALKTTTGVVSVGSISTGNDVDLTIPGGMYYLGLEANLASAGSSQWDITWGEPTLGVYGAIPLNVAKTSGSGSYGGNIRSTYIQASPPYDLGDGLIHDFIFLLIDSDGTIRGGYQAPDAPWHYNGPTIIKGDRYTPDGRVYKKVPKELAMEMRGEIVSSSFAYKQKREDFNIDSIIQTEFEEIEITQAYKNRDMNLIPHPFPKADPLQTVVMLDPVSDLCYKLQCLREQGGNALELLEEGRITFGNSAIKRAAPDGVLCVDMKWKNTVK